MITDGEVIILPPDPLSARRPVVAVAVEREIVARTSLVNHLHPPSVRSVRSVGSSPAAPLPPGRLRGGRG
eukprot:2637599-Pyramimonas_sp.AAC.1